MDEKLSVLPGMRCVAFDVYGTLFSSQSGDAEPVEGRSSPSVFDAILDGAGIHRLRSEAGHSCREWFFTEIGDRHLAMKKQGIEYPEVDIISVWQSVLEKLVLNGLACLEISPDLLLSTAIRAETILNPVFPMPGVDRLLTALSGMNVTKGIVSNAQFYTPFLFDAYLNTSLDSLGFDDRLRIWSYRVGIGKPSTRPFEILASRLESLYGIHAEQVVFVGNDMVKDIAAAASVGFRTILFAGDTLSLRLGHILDVAERPEPDAVITDLMRITELLSPGY